MQVQAILNDKLTLPIYNVNLSYDNSIPEVINDNLVLMIKDIEATSVDSYRQYVNLPITHVVIKNETTVLYDSTYWARVSDIRGSLHIPQGDEPESEFYIDIQLTLVAE